MRNIRKRIRRPGSSTDTKLTEKFRAVIDENISLTIFNNKNNKSICMIRQDLAKDYDVEVDASEAPLLNKILNDPEPYESSLGDINILEKEVFPINDSIKSVFGEDKGDLDLHLVKLAIGSSNHDYVTIDQSDLVKFDVNPTLSGLMDFYNENSKSILGFLDCEYITEEGNVVYLSCSKKNLSDNIRSIKLKIIASMQQRGLFLQQEHKYYGLQLYIIIESRIPDDDLLLQLLKELGINWEMIYLRRRLSIHDWTEIECEKSAENLKGYLRSKHDTLNYFDINNITRLVVKNQLKFVVADKMASLLHKMKSERARLIDEDGYSITLKKAEIVAAAKLSCAYLGIQEIDLEIDQDISIAEILKYEEELTHM